MTPLLEEASAIVLLAGSGITLGVFFAVAVSVSPALLTMTPERYVETHRLLGKGYHPVMPAITSITMVSGVVFTTLADGLPQGAAIAAVLAVVGVQVVSHLGNVPINRSLEGFEDTAPPGWEDPRPKWRFFHNVRTALAALAFLANCVAVTFPA